MLLISPHPDDAALSCGALLAREEPIDILTVFTRTPDPPRQGAWDRDTGFASSAQSMPVRLAEERAAFEGSRHRVALLDALEIQYLSGPRPRDDAEMIATAIVGWLERNRGSTIALPAGAGQTPGRLRTRARRLIRASAPSRHPDHIFVRDAALDAVASGVDARVVLYEEVPYLWGAPADREVQRVERERKLRAESVIVRVERGVKAARIAVYATQTPYLSVRGKRVDVAKDLPEDERYWILSAAPGP